MAVLQIAREGEFSPVKNAPGAAEDSPDTARALLGALHAGWARAAGARVEGDGVLEIAGEVSYEGEGLEALRGVAIATPALVRRKGDGGAVREGVTVVEV